MYFTFYHRTVGVSSHAHINHRQQSTCTSSLAVLPTHTATWKAMSSSQNGPRSLRSTDAVEECNSTPAKLDADRRPASAPIVQMHREVRPAMRWLKYHHQATACKPCAIRCSVCWYCCWLFVGATPVTTPRHPYRTLHTHTTASTQTPGVLALQYAGRLHHPHQAHSIPHKVCSARY